MKCWDIDTSMGSIVNALAVAVASCIGLCCRKLVSKRLEEAIMQMLGLSVSIIALMGIAKSMLVIDTASMHINDEGGILLLVSLVGGCIIGEWLNIDTHFLRLGKAVEKRFHQDGFAKGFVNASLIFCVGAMSIVGALQDGIAHDPSILYLKSALDFVTAVILSATLGIGVFFSVFTILLYQGLITVFAGFLAPFMHAAMLQSICMVGYAMVLCIGSNFLKLTSIKTANLLPSLFFPIAYQCLLYFV